MNVDLKKFFNRGETVGVALSGGSDSIALLHFLCDNSEKHGLKIVAINVEHGIRGNNSIKDSLFVKDYCEKNRVPLYSYSVDSKEYAEKNKVSTEAAARVLRYECFLDALRCGKCDKITTAHHVKDNFETVLINLFRGTGLKGLGGINDGYDGKIVRPFISVTKEEIMDYINRNNLPFVEDETNFEDDYSRNFIRHNVIPQIEKIFPEAERNVLRFSEIAKAEDEYLDNLAKKCITYGEKSVSIPQASDEVIFKRAVILSLKYLGVEKDWAKVHVDSVFSLISSRNGAKTDLPNNLFAVREYDKIIISKKNEKKIPPIPFSEGEFLFGEKVVKIEKTTPQILKDGFYVDGEKVGKSAVIRTRLDGDIFTKFGGGTKKLNDYFTDIKIPVRLRDSIPVIAEGERVLAVFGVAVSESVRVAPSSKTVYKLSIK